jgi:hypothetical protein
MNGEAVERFDEVFTRTRLVADVPWNAIIAAPPSTLVHVNSANGLGYSTETVWGFPGDPEDIRSLIARRFEAPNLNPDTVVEDDGLYRLALASGGLPRHAIRTTHLAVSSAIRADAPTLSRDHVTRGIDKAGEDLGRGLTLDSMRMLRKVHVSKMLIDNVECANLFAHGRILAHPPADGSRRPTFVVHPLLAPEVETFQDEAKGP